MPSEEPPCSRCERRGLSCVLHTSALRNPNADHRSAVRVIPCENSPAHLGLDRQIGLLGRDVSNIFSTLQNICDKLHVELPQPLLSSQVGLSLTEQSGDGNEEPGEDESGVYELSPPASPSTVQAPIDPYLSGGHPQKDASVLAGPVSGSPQRHRTRASEREDLVSKGVITQERAELLVQRYLLHLDRFLYGIASEYRDANQVRRASPTLLAAMCAVSAFQDVENRDVFDLCYKEYRSLVSTSLFEKRDLEYIRALCIGSFWLLDASRILLSDAIRRAADSRLHRYFHRLAEASTKPGSTSPPSPGNTGGGGRPPDAKGDVRDKIRLWYLLFVSDRHLSILHNRDALIRQEKDAIENRDDFLTSGDSGPASNVDIRLISQVSLLVIMGQIRDVLGCDRARPVPKTSAVQFSHFDHELEQWFGRYSASFQPDEHIGAFPLAGLRMHYRYARLYLYHHVFQGLGKQLPIPAHFLAAAAAAREAAHGIFAMTLEDAAFRAHIVGMPHYFHIMISFAGHFLLEVATRHREQLGVAVEEDFARVAAVLALFARTPARAQHPISRALAGLTRKLNESTAGLGMDSVLMGSPFQNAEYTSLMTGFGGDVTGGDAADPMLTSLDVQAISGLSDDFLYGDFGDFHLAFPESQSHFSA